MDLAGFLSVVLTLLLPKPLILLERSVSCSKWVGRKDYLGGVAGIVFRRLALGVSGVTSRPPAHVSCRASSP